jgi:hypothetical protein
MYKNISIQNQQVIETRDRRFAKGMVVAMSCEIIEIDERGTYKVQSTSNTEKYYTVKFIDGTPIHCDCKDWEYRSRGNPNHICIHMRGVVFAENHGLVSNGIKKEIMSPSRPLSQPSDTIVIGKSYIDDNYSF